MSDFGADACDFHSDFASDFASDFRDFPGDFSGDFGGEPRTAKWPPETPGHRERTTGAGHPPTKPQANEGGGKLAAHRASCKPRSGGQRHAIGP